MQRPTADTVAAPAPSAAPIEQLAEDLLPPLKGMRRPPGVRAPSPRADERVGSHHCHDRALVFGRWAAARFAPLLKAGTWLDVAGGKGELALVLSAAGAEHVTVVDRRARAGMLSTRARKQLRRTGVTPFSVLQAELGPSPCARTREALAGAALLLGRAPRPVEP